MSYREKIQQVYALLKEGQEEADWEEDYPTGDRVGYAFACCLDTEIVAYASALVGSTFKDIGIPNDEFVDAAVHWRLGGYLCYMCVECCLASAFLRL